jgi:hypothetical protein
MAIAALITWVITAGLGLFMLGTWIAKGGARAQTMAGATATAGAGATTGTGGGAGADGPADTTGSNFPPPAVFGHFLLAASGLVLWIVYVVNDDSTLAWIAFGILVIVAGIGDFLVLRWIGDRRAASRGLAEQKIPSGVVAVHGVFAVTTLVLVLLAALEVGGS